MMTICLVRLIEISSRTSLIKSVAATAQSYLIRYVSYAYWERYRACSISDHIVGELYKSKYSGHSARDNTRFIDRYENFKHLCNDTKSLDTKEDRAILENKKNSVTE